MHGLVGNLIFPNDLAVPHLEGGGAHVTEVDVDDLALDDRGRAGEAVFRMLRARFLGVRGEEVGVPEGFAACRVDGEGAEDGRVVFLASAG